MQERSVDVAILGAGTAGVQAMAQARKAGRSFVMMDGGPLGTTCARVGCMPSKIAIQIGDDLHRSHHAFATEGLGGGDGVGIDRDAAMRYLRGLRDGFVSKTNARTVDTLGEDQLIRQNAEFLEPDLLQAGDTRIRAKAIVIATGSRPVVPAPWAKEFGDAVLTTDTLFELETLPARLAVIGLGVIGLELGQAFSRWGISVAGFDLMETIAGLQDPLVRDAAIAAFGEEIPLHLGAAATPEKTTNGIVVSANGNRFEADAILASMGRRANVDRLNLAAAGIPVNSLGIPDFNPHTMQIGDLPIFLAGDANAERAILHEAGDEGRIAGWNAARIDDITRFERKTPLAIVFTDPNIALVGAPYSEIDSDPNVVIGTSQMVQNGRTKVLGQQRGLVRVYGDKRSGKLLGATVMGIQAEHLGHLLAWAIQAGLDVFDAIRMPHYHPVVEEVMQNALRDLAGQVEQQTSYPWDIRPIA